MRTQHRFGYFLPFLLSAFILLSASNCAGPASIKNPTPTYPVIQTIQEFPLSLTPTTTFTVTTVATNTVTTTSPPAAEPAIVPSTKDQHIASPDGQWTAVFNGDTGGLEIEDTAGRKFTALSPASLVEGVNWSPDSRQLAVSARRADLNQNPTQTDEIWLARMAGDTLEVKLLYTPAAISSSAQGPGLQIILGVWSPDIRHLLFWQGMVSASIQADGLPLWAIDVQTGQTMQLAKTTLVNPAYQSWAPDSGAVVFTNGGYRSAQVMKWLSLFQVAPGKLIDLVPTIQLVPGEVAWSPDGRWIAFAAVEASKTSMDPADYMGWDNPAILARRIYLLDPQTGKYQRLNQAEAYQDAPRWNGNELFYVQMDRNQARLLVATMDNRKTKAIPGCETPLPPNAGYYGQVDWSALYSTCKEARQSTIPFLSTQSVMN